MTLLLLVCGLAAVALPGLRPRPMLVGSPRWFVRLAALSVCVGATTIVGALCLSTAVGLIHVVGGVAETPVDHFAPEGLGGSFVAGAVLTWILLRTTLAAARAWRGRREGRVEPWLGEHRAAGGVDVVLLPTDAAVAYNIPGRNPQIVLSSGLQDVLPAEVFRFVIDHERAHLRARDRRSALLATIVETVFVFVPGAARTAGAMRIALERAADEEAAGPEPTRRRAIARGIAEGPHGRGGDREVVAFRAQHLTSATGHASSAVSLAVAGVLTVAIAGGAAALHARADFTLYLASL